MHSFTNIFADSDPMARGIIFVIVLISWGISALAKALKNSNEKEKQRRRAVRQSIEQSQRIPQQRAAQQAGRAPAPAPARVQSRPQAFPKAQARRPVQLAPEIARRVPPPRATRPPQKRQPQLRRGPTDYNAMAQATSRPAPPPLPALTKKQPVLEEVDLIPDEPAALMSSQRKPPTVGAVAIRKWLRPMTLRQQFILTELFQPPIALRENHLR
jgi:hypothetical protein